MNNSKTKLLKEKFKGRIIINAFVMALIIMCVGFMVKPEVAKAGTYGIFEFSMNTETNEISINGLNDSAAGITDIVIPAQINGYVVTKISDNAFKNAGIISVSFESATGVKTIGSSAFSGCEKLVSINLPVSLRSIGSSMFEGCTSLQTIVIPEGIIRVESRMFKNCTSLALVTLPNTLTSIRSETFSGCSSLKSINIPVNVEEIWGDAFSRSGLESIVIPDSVTWIDDGAFANCISLVSATLSKNIKTVEGYLFNGCSALKSISLPMDLESIHWDAFSDCIELESVTIGDAIKSIDKRAFNNCPKLVVSVVRGTVAEAYCMNNNKKYVTYASSIRGCAVEGIVEKTYSGSAQTQNLVVKLGVVPLTQGVDYTVAYSNNVNVGTATITITGTGNYIGHIDKTFRIAAVNIDKAKIKMKSKVKYNAKYQTPSVKVTLNGKTLPAGSYSVSYYGNCFVGNATVTVSGKGNYTGTIKRTFNIVPKGTKIKSVKGGRKSIVVSYKENHIQTTGYQIQYSTSKKFAKKNTKIAGVASNKVLKKTITGLKSNKKYYVRVRTVYKNYSGNKLYSSWSAVKSVRVK